MMRLTNKPTKVLGIGWILELDRRRVPVNTHESKLQDRDEVKRKSKLKPFYIPNIMIYNTAYKCA